MDDISTVYDGITITYNERSNKWVFELRGRERSVDSLQLAKEAIDKPVPKKVKPFDRIKAWFLRYDELQACEVTSIAEPGYGGETMVWIVLETSGRFKSKGERSKESASSVVPRSEDVDAKVAEIVAVQKQVKDLESKLSTMRHRLPRLKVADEQQN